MKSSQSENLTCHVASALNNISQNPKVWNIHGQIAIHRSVLLWKWFPNCSFILSGLSSCRTVVGCTRVVCNGFVPLKIKDWLPNSTTVQSLSSKWYIALCTVLCWSLCVLWKARTCLLKAIDQPIDWIGLGKLVLVCKREKLRANLANFLSGLLYGVCRGPMSFNWQLWLIFFWLCTGIFHTLLCNSNKEDP